VFGTERTCQNCGQVGGLPTGIRTSSAGKRFGEIFLELLLFIVTLAIGWLIWAFIVSKNGQGPAKSVLGMRVVKLPTSRHATRGEMFVRWLVKRIMGAIPIVGLLSALWILWDKNRQALWDKVVDTVVVDDKEKRLLQQ